MSDQIAEGAEGIQQILRMREEGALFAELTEGREYVLMAYEVYPNGTTSNLFVQDPEIAKTIGSRMGIGAPSDPQGWAIWTVPGG